MQKKIKIFLIITVPCFLIAHFLGWWKYYYTINGYDKLVHFLAGASVIIVVYWFLQIKTFGRSTLAKNKQLISLIALFFVSICWEVFEYLVDNVIGHPSLQPLQMGWIDTLGDFLANFTGAIIVLILFYLKQRKKG